MTVSGLSGLFSRALDGLRVSSKGMTVVANNIANVNTEGYSRQILVQGARGVFGDGTYGGGVIAIGISALIDPFVERQLVNEMSDFGTLESRQSVLAHIESVLNETNQEGLGGAITQFFNSWSELTQDASSGTLRQSVRERGIALAEQFNSLHTKLQNLRRNISQSIETRLETVNGLTKNIADLNRSISQAPDEATRTELKSHRQLLLRKLSEEVGINYYENSDDTVTVQFLGSGQALVDRYDSAVLTANNDLGIGGNLSISATIPNGSGNIEVTNYIKSGRLGGLLQERNITLNNNIKDLNNLAYEFATQFNAIHQTGFGLDGTDGRNFFTALAGPDNAAAFISVDAAVRNDLDVIAAAAGDPNTTGVGDAGVAEQLVALRDALSMDGSTQTFNEFYSNMVSSIGVSAGQINAQYQSKITLLNRLSIQRENVSGVNMDEEAADLIRYQKAFEGAARVMSVANQMLETLMRL